MFVKPKFFAVLELRTIKGMSQEELAEKVLVTRQAVSRWETRETVPNTETLMLLIDPVYLSVLCGFFGGGDMNGISLLFPELAIRIVYGIILAINIAVFVKIILPKYQLAFSK